MNSSHDEFVSANGNVNVRSGFSSSDTSTTVSCDRARGCGDVRPLDVLEDEEVEDGARFGFEEAGL